MPNITAGMTAAGRKGGPMILIDLDPHAPAHQFDRNRKNTKAIKVVGRRIDHNLGIPLPPMKSEAERKHLQRKLGLEVSKKSLLLSDLGQTRVLQNLLREGTLN